MVPYLTVHKYRDIYLLQLFSLNLGTLQIKMLHVLFDYTADYSPACLVVLQQIAFELSHCHIFLFYL